MSNPFRELAERLATPEGLRQARLAQMAGLTGSSLFSPLSRREGGDGRGGQGVRGRGPHPISIWQPTEIDGGRAFVRPDPGPFGDHYAIRKVLRPKQAELP